MKKENEIIENENVKKETIILVTLFIIILGILIASIQLFNKQAEKDVKKDKNKEEVIKIKQDKITDIPKKEEVIAYVPVYRYTPVKEKYETIVSPNFKLLGITMVGNVIKVNGIARYEEIDDDTKLNFIDIKVALKKNADLKNTTIYFGAYEVNAEDLVYEENGVYYFDYVDTIHGVQDEADITIDYKDEIVEYFIDSSEVKALKEVEDINVKKNISVPSNDEKNSIVGNQELTYDFKLLEEDKKDDETTNIDTEINYVLKFEGVINYYENGEMERVGLGDYNSIVVVKIFAPSSLTEDDFKNVRMEISRPEGKVLNVEEFKYDGLDNTNNRYYKYIYNTVETEEAPWFSVDWDGEGETYDKEIYTYDLSNAEINTNPEEEIEILSDEIAEEEEIVEA